MACLKLNAALPTLAGGLGFGAAIPPFSFDPTLCCKRLPFPISTPPIPLGGVGIQIPTALLIALAAGEVGLFAYLDLIQIDCPNEGS